MARRNRPAAAPRFLRRPLITAGVLCLAAATVALAGCESRSGLTPQMVVEGFKASPDLPVTNPRNITSERCGADGSSGIGCKEAVQADEITVYSFAGRSGFCAVAGQERVPVRLDCARI